MQLFVAVPIMLATLSCGRRPNEIVHPTEENLPPADGPVIRSEETPVGLDSVALAAWSKTRDALLSEWSIKATVGQIGEIEYDGPDVFGIEMDLAIHDNDIVVLDQRNYAVKIFDGDGRYIGGFGRAGGGPGEFRDPAAIEVLSDGRFVVLDRGREIKIYSPTDSGYAYTESQTIDVVPEYICSEGDRVFVSGFRSEDETMIHEIPLTKQGRAQDFGQGYQSDHWLARDQLSDGPVACLGSPPRVVLAFERLPVVRGYAADGGELLWTTRNMDYLQPPIVEKRDGSGRLGIQFSYRGARDMVASLVTVSSHHILLQYVRFEPQPDPADVRHEVRSYLIDAETGQGAFVSDSLPLMAAIGQDYYVAKWVLPFPRIEVRAFSDPSG